MTRVLLVEDSDDHADIITRSLTTRKGWDVVRAITVKEALLQAALKPFDIAIVDYRLPDGDGIDLLDSLRKQKPGLPILFLTAHGSEEVAFQAMSRGAADYVVKGLHYQKELPGRVTEVLGRSEDLARMAAAIRHSGDAAPPAQAQGAAKAAAATAPPRRANSYDPKALARVLKGVVAGEVVGAAVFDADGRSLSARLPAGVEADALGAGLVGTQFQAQQSLRHVPQGGPPRALLLDYEAGVLAVAPVPGPALVVLLYGRDVDRNEALRGVRDAAHQVWESSRA